MTQTKKPTKSKHVFEQQHRTKRYEGKLKATKPAAHPMQPLYVDGEGVIRFKSNQIVRFLLDWASPRGMDLNILGYKAASGIFSKEDEEQFAQLIGYSVSGAGDLSYMSDEVIGKADKLAAKLCRGPRTRR